MRFSELLDKAATSRVRLNIAVWASRSFEVALWVGTASVFVTVFHHLFKSPDRHPDALPSLAPALSSVLMRLAAVAFAIYAILAVTDVVHELRFLQRKRRGFAHYISLFVVHGLRFVLFGYVVFNLFYISNVFARQ